MELKRSGTNFIIDSLKLRLIKACRCRSLSEYINRSIPPREDDLAVMSINQLSQLLRCEECKATWMVQRMTDTIPEMVTENRAETTFWKKLQKVLNKTPDQITYWDVYSEFNRIRPGEVSGFGAKSIMFICKELNLPIPMGWVDAIEIIKNKDATKRARNLTKIKRFTVVVTDQQLLELVREVDQLQMTTNNKMTMFKIVKEQLVDRNKNRLRSDYD